MTCVLCHELGPTPWEEKATTKAAASKGWKGYQYQADNERWWAPKAVPQSEAYHCSILRAFPGERGEVLIKRGAAKKDMDLLTPEGVSARLTPGNHEGLSRPDKWLSMTAASVRQGIRVVPFVADDISQAGLTQLQEALSNDELLAAAALLDSTSKEKGGPEEVKKAVEILLQHATTGLTWSHPCSVQHSSEPPSTSTRCKSLSPLGFCG